MYLAADRNTIKQQPHLKVIQVQYESFHAAIEEQRKALYEFLEVDPALATAIPDSMMPGHKKENPNQFFRKGVVGDWKNYMTDEAREWVNIEAGAEMIRQGYIGSMDW